MSACTRRGGAAEGGQRQIVELPLCGTLALAVPNKAFLVPVRRRAWHDGVRLAAKLIADLVRLLGLKELSGVVAVVPLL